MNSDSFLTIDTSGIGEIREKGSKFIALAYPIHTEEEVEQILVQIRDEYPKASHYCYAFKTGPQGEHFRINDDGEPSGTAGKPIIGQINRLGLTNTIVIVIRYFGGTKLGVSGLIQAYKEAAKLALENARYKETVIHNNYELTFSYTGMGHIMAVLKELPIEIMEKHFENSCRVTFSVRQSITIQTLTRLTAGILRVSVQEVADPMEIPGCTLKKLAEDACI
jgi:uncharacterized YigZ family protein